MQACAGTLRWWGYRCRDNRPPLAAYTSQPGMRIGMDSPQPEGGAHYQQHQQAGIAEPLYQRETSVSPPCNTQNGQNGHEITALLMCNIWLAVIAGCRW